MDKELVINLNIPSPNSSVSAKDITNGAMLFKRYKDEERAYWTGEGIFDTLISSVSEVLRSLYENGAITKQDFATALSTTLPTIMDKAIAVAQINEELKLKDTQATLAIKQAEAELALKLKDLEIKQKQLELAEAESKLKQEQLKREAELTQAKIRNLEANTAVLNRQRQGFDDNIAIKLLSTQLDNYAMMVSSGMMDHSLDGNSPANIFGTSNLTASYNAVKARIRT